MATFLILEPEHSLLARIAKQYDDALARSAVPCKVLLSLAEYEQIKKELDLGPGPGELTHLPLARDFSIYFEVEEAGRRYNPGAEYEKAMWERMRGGNDPAEHLS